MNKLGAPRKYSDEQLQKVGELIKEGIHQSEACRKVGVKVNTYTAYKSRRERGVKNENRTA